MSYFKQFQDWTHEEIREMLKQKEQQASKNNYYASLEATASNWLDSVCDETDEDDLPTFDEFLADYYKM